MKKIIRFLFILALIVIFFVACDSVADETEFNSDAGALDSGDATKTVFTVTYKSVSHGKIQGNTKQIVEYGESASSVIAIPDNGYEFVMWSDGLKTAVRRDKMVTANITVSPVFVKKTADITYVGVPVISIETITGNDITSKETYVDCSVSISGTQDEYCFENTIAKIRGRGNSSWSKFPKKSYRLKFDKKTSLFGSDYRAKDWTLIANYCDKSLSRNAIAQELAQRFDAIAFSSMHQFVEVYLNGEYDGVYLLCDQIETGEGRVDVSEEFTADGDTGYLIEMDARAPEEAKEGIDYFIMENDDGHYYRLKTPDTEDPNYDPDIYLTFIKEYMEDSMYAINDLKDWDEICNYIDVESFAESYIVLELMANLDCHAFSFYFYKEKGGKLCCGPVWDFDISSGNNNYGYSQPEGSITEAMPDLDMQVYGELWVAKQNRWFRRLLRVQEFEDLVAQKLEKYESTIEDVITLLETDESNPNTYYALYGEAMNRNFERWSIMGSYVWPNTQAIVEITTVKGQIDYLHDWLTERHVIVRNRFGLV